MNDDPYQWMLKDILSDPAVIDSIKRHCAVNPKDAVDLASKGFAIFDVDANKPDTSSIWDDWKTSWGKLPDWLRALDVVGASERHRSLSPMQVALAAHLYIVRKAKLGDIKIGIGATCSVNAVRESLRDLGLAPYRRKPSVKGASSATVVAPHRVGSDAAPDGMWTPAFVNKPFEPPPIFDVVESPPTRNSISERRLGDHTFAKGQWYTKMPGHPRAIRGNWVTGFVLTKFLVLERFYHAPIFSTGGMRNADYIEATMVEGRKSSGDCHLKNLFLHKADAMVDRLAARGWDPLKLWPTKKVGGVIYLDFPEHPGACEHGVELDRYMVEARRGRLLDDSQWKQITKDGTYGSVTPAVATKPKPRPTKPPKPSPHKASAVKVVPRIGSMVGHGVPLPIHYLMSDEELDHVDTVAARIKYAKRSSGCLAKVKNEFAALDDNAQKSFIRIAYWVLMNQTLDVLSRIAKINKRNIYYDAKSIEALWDCPSCGSLCLRTLRNRTGLYGLIRRRGGNRKEHYCEECRRSGRDNSAGEVKRGAAIAAAVAEREKSQKERHRRDREAELRRERVEAAKTTLPRCVATDCKVYTSASDDIISNPSIAVIKVALHSIGGSGYVVLERGEDAHIEARPVNGDYLLEYTVGRSAPLYRTPDADLVTIESAARSIYLFSTGADFHSWLTWLQV